MDKPPGAPSLRQLITPFARADDRKAAFQLVTTSLLSSRVPNYHLREWHESSSRLRQGPLLTLRTSLACLGLKLWDERAQRLVPFSAIAGPA